jgi:uncharacterized phage-like protein YoqJ
MYIAVTGHRPNKLGFEWDGVGPISDALRNELRIIIEKYNPERILSGMALGVDMLWAEVGIAMDVTVVACIPCRDQEKIWRPNSQSRYHVILNHPNVTQVLVSTLPYHPDLMSEQNRWMVDHSNMLVSVWDGSPGGTANCVQYAEQVKRPILPVDIKKIRREHGSILHRD